MKRCPVCQTRFKDTTIKCRYCDVLLEPMDQPSKPVTPSKRRRKRQKKTAAAKWQIQLQKLWSKYWYWVYIIFILIIVSAVGFKFLSKKSDMVQNNAQSEINRPSASVMSAILSAETTSAPQSARDLYNGAYALCYNGKCTNPQKAIEYLNDAIKLKPDYAEAFNNRGIAYFDLGQYERAIEDYSESIRIKPDEGSAYHNRGNAYHKLGQYERALEDFNEAIRLRPQLTAAYLGRGMNYYKTGNKELYCQDMKKACELGSCKEEEIAKSREGCK